MKEVLVFLLGFSPWILFGILAGSSLLRLDIAIVACLVLSLLVGFKQLKKGFLVAWGTLIFFVFALVSVVFMKNVWVAEHLDILVSITLAGIAWMSLAIKKPFALQYAR